MNYDHYTDQSVAIAVDLINDFGTAPLAAAGRGDEPLGDIAAFLRAHGLDDTAVVPDDAAAASALADRLHDVFTATSSDRAVAVVNSVLADVGALPQISGHDGQDWHLHFHPTHARPLDRLAVTTAMALAAVLCSGGIRRLGRCDGIACRDVYVDTSRNNRRRFCGDTCANCTHVAAHRARERSGAS